ncbi:MAG: TolC family protein [Paraprevotella sp.]|nr:TolC family protein [Paraprevotella sp.]
MLCLLDQEQKSYAARLAVLLGRQMTVVKNLAAHGLGRITDLRLLAIEMEADSVLQNTYRQDYRTHLSELNILCGISDTTEVRLSPVILQMKTSSGTSSAFMEQYRLDSLNAWASLHAFNQQYHPRLDLFIDGGLQISQYNQMYRHFGWSAGLTFAWTLFDGKQKRWKERQTLTQISTIEDYKNNFLLQQSQRKRQYLSEIKSYETRKILMDRQLAEYDFLLADYRKEMRDGQVSVIDYISVLRNKIQTEKDRMLLDTNRQLLLVAFNYWNW